MVQTNSILWFLILAAGIALLLRYSMVDALIEAINNFRDNFRGGPPSPMHPSPADDAVLLRKRARNPAK